MSEGIVHTAIVDDSIRLLEHDSTICPLFRHAVAEHKEIARLGGITRRGDFHNPHLLEKWHGQWSVNPYELSDEQAGKLAFFIGWMGHQAADRQFKPVFCKLDGDCTLSPYDCSVYHDVWILRQVYGAQNMEGETLSPDILFYPDTATDSQAVACRERSWMNVWRSAALNWQDSSVAGAVEVDGARWPSEGGGIDHDVRIPPW